MEDLKKSILQYLKESVRNIPDFPKKGIQYKDITTLLRDPEALKLTSGMLAKPFLNESIDYVAGLESRGFLFGPQLAQSLNAGFIAIRKPGKLPAKTVTATYELEYGTDQLEMHADAIAAGDRVLIHDDLLATGGSAAAANELIRALEGTITGYSFIIALDGLNGRDALDSNAPVEALLSL